MASIHKFPRSRYYLAYWRDRSGKQFTRSTRSRNRVVAQTVADQWEALSRLKEATP